MGVVAAAIVAGIVFAWRTGYFDATRLDTIRSVIRTARGVPFAPLLFLGAYTLAVMVLLPTTPLSVIGGALFGVPGLALSWLGAMLGSAGAYSIGRYTARGAARRFLGNHPMVRQLRDDASVLDLMRLRALPVAPFGVLDYLAGMSAIRLRALLFATGIGVLPTMAAYVFAGRALARALEGGASASRALWVAGAITVVLVLAAVSPTLVKVITRRERHGTR